MTVSDVDSGRPGVLIILMTAPDAGEGERIAGRLLEEGLIACANIVPRVVSLYRWEGELRRDEEVLVIMKTTASRASQLVARTEELHPYDVPEVLVHEVAGGAARYLNWVEQQCR